ncbi:MAG: hypothetical protein ACP5Q0_03015, partial [Halothiobacillus sp.]
VDLDGVNSDRIWRDLRRQFHGPAIVLSVREQTLRNAYCLAKPFNAQAFLAVLEQVKKELTQPAALPSAKPSAGAQTPMAANGMAARIPAATPHLNAHQSAQPLAAKPSPGLNPNSASTAAPVNNNTPALGELAQARASDAVTAKHIKTDQPSNAAHLISDESDDEGSFQLPDEAYTDPRRRAELFFNPNQTLTGLCKLALKQAKTTNSVVLIDGLLKPCYIYPDAKHLLTEMRWRYLKSVSMINLTASPLKLSLVPLESIAPLSSNDPRIRETEGIIWSIAAWSSRGRVPVGTPLDQPVHLLHWPNLTRLSDIPGAMQISALWTKQPTSLMDTAVFLGLPYRHVFSFYVACQALGLVHIEVAAQHTPVQMQGNAPAPKAAPIATEKRGLFSRMLSKLGIK